MKPIRKRVLVVDDEQPILDVVEYALRKEGFDADCVKTGERAVEKVRGEPPDAVVLDIKLPGIDGFDACRRIRGFSRVPIIMLSSKSEEVDKIIGLETGADAYVPKPFSPRELVAVVKAVLRRAAGDGAAPGQGDDLYRLGGFALDRAKARISFNSKPLLLSKVEYNILGVLLKEPGRVFSREELMDLAWGKDYVATDRTIDTHIKMIRKQIKRAGGDFNLIETKRGLGYSLRETGR